NVTLTFDDAASRSLPNFNKILSGTYKPTDVEPQSDDFLPPAPGGPYEATLSVFRGLDPNGVWSLYVLDDTTPDSGFIANGWSLQFLSLDTIADVAVAAVASPDPVPATSNLTYTITALNHGPAAASGVRLTDSLPGLANLVSFSTSQGACTN